MQVIVILRWLMTIRGVGTDNVKHELLPYLVPAHTLPSNNEMHIRRAQMKWRPRSRTELLRSSSRSLLVEIREPDAAGPNMSLVTADELSSLQFNFIMLFHQLCLIHQLNIVVTMILELLRPGDKNAIVSTLYCASKLVRQPGYFDKMLSHVPSVVRMCLVIRRGEAPDPAWRTVLHTGTRAFQSLPTGALHVHTGRGFATMPRSLRGSLGAD